MRGSPGRLSVRRACAPSSTSAAPAREVALQFGQDAAGVQRFDSVEGRLRWKVCKEAVQPASPLAEQAPGEPERGARRAAMRSPMSGLSDTQNSIASRRFGCSRSSRAIQSSCRALIHSASASAVNCWYQSRCRRRSSTYSPVCLELLMAVVAQGLEHPEPHHGSRIPPGSGSTCPPGRPPLEQIRRCQAVPADLFRGIEFEAAGEHRQPRPHPLLLRGAQVVAPVDTQPQRLLPRRRASAAAGQQRVPVGQPVQGSARATSPATGRPPVRSAAANRPAGGRSRRPRPGCPR